ncbi:hypothetical protein BAE44_0012428, partial [Dichanthelium oligosanthes]
LTPRTLALMVRQTQMVASRSASPEMRDQQGSLDGPPTPAWISPSSTSAHTPSFAAFNRHLPVGFGHGCPPHAAAGATPRDSSSSTTKAASTTACYCFARQESAPAMLMSECGGERDGEAARDSNRKSDPIGLLDKVGAIRYELSSDDVQMFP